MLAVEARRERTRTMSPCWECRDAPVDSLRSATMDLLDEGELLEGLRRGDEGSFEILVRHYGGRMLSVARRLLRVEEDAQDAVQEAFLSIFRSIDRFRGESALSTWLHRIVVNTALMKLRRVSSRPEVKIEDCLPSFDPEGRHAGPIRPWSTPADSVLREETRAQVRERIAMLPPMYRMVVVLRDIEGWDTAETARALGISSTAVKVRLHRARRALVSLLRDVFDGDAPRRPPRSPLAPPGRPHN